MSEDTADIRLYGTDTVGIRLYGTDTVDKDFTVLTRSYCHVSDEEEGPPFVSMIC